MVPDVISLSRGEREVRKPPLEEATERLAALDGARLNTDGARKAFYVELSDILRTYIWRRLGPPALESTSREVLDDLAELSREGRAPDAMLTPLRHLLETSDLAKFAELFPAESRCRDSISEARQLLDLVEDFLTPSPDLEETDATTLVEDS